MGNRLDYPNAKPNDSEHVTLDNDNFSFGAPAFQTVGSSAVTEADASVDRNKEKHELKKKTLKSKNKKESSSSYRNTFVVDDSYNKTDMYEITPDEDLDNYTLLSPSPAVPELIVDVLKADVSSDRSDIYSVPSLDIDTSKSNLVETTKDDNMNHNETDELGRGNGNSPDDKWLPDSGMHYPIMFRRSKKDPGSKQYNELVKELSTVLKKRAEATRTHSFSENRSDTASSVESVIHSKESKQTSRSFENLNVFSDKSLLSKLETHLINKNLKMMSGEHYKKSTDKRDAESYSHVHTAHGLHRQEHNNSDEKLRTGAAISEFGDSPQSVGSKAFDNKQRHVVSSKEAADIKEEPVYSIPNKTKKVAGTGNMLSAKTEDYAKVNASVDTSYARVKALSGTSEGITYFTKSREADASTDQTPSQHFLDSRKEHDHQERQSFVTSQAGPDNKSFSSSAETVSKSLPGLSYSTDDLYHQSYHSGDIYFSSVSSSSMMSSALPASRSGTRSTEDSWSDSQGHVTTIEVSGGRLKRRGKIMYSEPDLTREGSLTSDSGAASDVEGRYTVVTGKTHSSVILPAHVYSFDGLRHQDKGTRRWNHVKAHRSLDNLHSDSSFESKDLTHTHVASTSFLHNQSYDISFGNETFDDDDSFHGSCSDHHSDSDLFGKDSSNDYIVKVQVGDIGIGYSEYNTNFVERPRPVNREGITSYSNSSLPRSDLVTEFDGKSQASLRYNMDVDSAWSSSYKQYGQSLDRKATIMREVSQRSSSSSSSHASSRSKIARSQTLERNSRNQRQNDHQQQRRLYVKRSPRREFSFSSSATGSGHRSEVGPRAASTSTGELSASQIFVVVPPQANRARVPDLIVDHQQTQKQVQLLKQQNGGY